MLYQVLHFRLTGILLLLLSLSLAGCAGGVAGEGGSIRMVEAPPAPGIPAQHYAATIRLLPFVDGRGIQNPRQIGTGGKNIFGLNAPKGNEILLEQEVAEVFTALMRRRLEDAGYRVVTQGEAHFEMTGTIRELTYNVKNQDEVDIAVETSIKDIASGKELWKAVVQEKNARFAGVAGDDIADVAAYFQHEVGVVTQKTSDAISAVLMAQRPDLFGLMPGTKPIAGVTVMSPPNAGAQPSATASMSARGAIQVRTKPARAKIYVDGVYYGLAPQKVELPVGIVEVSARMEGHKDASEKVAVRKGQTVELDLTLKR